MVYTMSREYKEPTDTMIDEWPVDPANDGDVKAVAALARAGKTHKITPRHIAGLIARLDRAERAFDQSLAEVREYRARLENEAEHQRAIGATMVAAMAMGAATALDRIEKTMLWNSGIYENKQRAVAWFVRNGFMTWRESEDALKGRQSVSPCGTTLLTEEGGL